MDLEALRKLDEKGQLAALQVLEEFIDELNRRSLENEWSLSCAADMANCIGAYEDAVKGLSSEQKEAVERYIAACEELEYSHVYIAYELGREHERMGVPFPPLWGNGIR